MEKEKTRSAAYTRLQCTNIHQTKTQNTKAPYLQATPAATRNSTMGFVTCRSTERQQNPHEITVSNNKQEQKAKHRKYEHSSFRSETLRHPQPVCNTTVYLQTQYCEDNTFHVSYPFNAPPPLPPPLRPRALPSQSSSTCIYAVYLADPPGLIYPCMLYVKCTTVWYPTRSYRPFPR